MKCLNIESMTIEQIKEELLWLKGFDTDWSKEISNLLKKELEFTKFQTDVLRKEVREEKNKNLVMESLLNQYKK